MNAVKRALLHMIRRKASSILFIVVLLAVFVLLFLGISFINAAEEENRNIRESVGGAFTLSSHINHEDPELWEDVEMPDGVITQVYKDPVSLTDDTAEKILKAGGIDRYNAEIILDGFYTDMELKDGFATTLIEDRFLDPDYANGSVTEDDKMFFTRMMSSVTLRGNTRSADDKFFRIGAYDITEGEHVGPGDIWKAVISEEVAQRNGLGVGDTFTSNITEELINSSFGSPDMTPAEFTFEIAGIYRMNFSFEPSLHTYETEMPENMVFVNTETLSAIVEKRGGIPGRYKSLTFFLNDASDMDQVVSDVKAIDDILWEYMSIERDDSAYASIKEPLDAINNAGLLLVFCAAIGGALILFLMINMKTRSRCREIGIYRAVGISKNEIFRQFLAEYIMIGIIAFLLAVLLASVLITPFGNAMDEMMSADASSPQFVTELDEFVQFDVDLKAGKVDLEYTSQNTYLIPALIGTAIIFFGVMIPMKRIQRYGPKELLSDRYF